VVHPFSHFSSCYENYLKAVITSESSEAVLKISATQKRSAKIKAEGRFFAGKLQKTARFGA